MGGKDRGDDWKSVVSFKANEVEYMRIDVDFYGHTLGNVGIGTSVPAYKLDVVGDINTTGAFRVNGSPLASGIGGSGTVNYLPVFTPNATTLGNSTIYQSGGNTGIGTTAPSEKLEVYHGNIKTDYGITAATGAFSGAVATGQLTVNSTASVTGSAFSVGGSTLVVSGGNVGIGTTAPAQLLDVAGSAYLHDRLLTPFWQVGSAANRTFLTMTSNGAKYGSLQIENAGGGGAWSLAHQDSPGTAIGTPVLTWTGDDKVGIGTTAPSTKLDVAGTIQQSAVKSCALGLTTDANGGITGCVSSDKNLKEEITDSRLTGDEVLKLRPVQYKWKDRFDEKIETSLTGRDGKPVKINYVRKAPKDGAYHYGFVAQEVQKVLPYAVAPAGENLLGVDSNALIAVLVKKIQKQDEQMQKQDARIVELTKRLAALEAKSE